MIKFYNEANFDRDNDFFCCSVGGEKYTVSPDENGKIEIPVGISKVENYTHFWNTTLKELVVPASVKSLSIRNCDELQKISLAMKVVPSNAITQCGQHHACKLELVLQKGVEEVEYAAFNCCDFGKIVLPASIKKFPLDAVIGTVCEIDFKNVCDKIVDMEPSSRFVERTNLRLDSKSWLGILQNYPQGIYLMDDYCLTDKNFVNECKTYIVKGMEMRRHASEKSGDAAKEEAAKNIKLMKDIDKYILDLQFNFAQQEAVIQHDEKTEKYAQQYDKLDYSAAREKFLK